MSDNPIVPVGQPTLALAANANVADEGKAAGVSFGALVKATGLAVGTTQAALNENSAATATALANTLVEVIAIQERNYDDQGNVTSAASHSLKLPLINFIDPVFYQWSRVRLQGYFFAREFASDSSTSSTVSTVSAGGGASFGGFLFGSGNFNLGVTSTSLDVETSTDTSFGMVRMNALLEPRRDIGIPRPTQVIQGPSLAIIQGQITNVPATGVPTSRTMELLIEYRKRDGSPISGKAISIETNGVPWSFNTTPAETDADGHLAITLQRDFVPGPNPTDPIDTSPQEFVVSARIGLVQNSTTVVF